MEAFAPEFSAYWLNQPSQLVGGDHADRDAGESYSLSTQLALEELADLVNAARSVV